MERSDALNPCIRVHSGRVFNHFEHPPHIEHVNPIYTFTKHDKKQAKTLHIEGVA